MDQSEEDLNLSFLLEHERDVILKVLQKDEKLRKREEKRIRKLKNELLEMRCRGSRGPDVVGERRCGRCLKNLGLIFDRGDFCPECRLRVCSLCRVLTPGGQQWKCSVCAKISELRVVTGEWFLEQRSKRFVRGVPSGDVIKDTILSSPILPIRKSVENESLQSEAEVTDSPRSSRSSALSSMDDTRRRRRVVKAERKGRRLLKPDNDGVSAKSGSDGDTRSVRSVRSARSALSGRSSPRSNRGGPVAVESSGSPVVLNNLRCQTPDASSPHSDRGRVMPDGAESVSSFPSTDSGPEKRVLGHHRTGSGTPVISVSRASTVSSDYSRSEMDLSAPGSEPSSEEALSLRSRSVPGLNDTEFSDADAGAVDDEDIDALMSAHRKTVQRRLSNAKSTSSTPGSERRWSSLNVPDSDAETTSINSMMSVYSDTGYYGNAAVSGEILLNVSYSYKTGALNVHVKECHNLGTGDERKQRTDAYVKTYLLPDTSRQSKRKTCIKANSINPVFNETLRYVISHSQLETRTLQVSVWHHDRFRHNSFLGEAELTFDGGELDSQTEDWYPLQPKVQSSMESSLQYKGELTVVLKYIPAEKNLTLPLDQVQVKKRFLKGKKSSTFTLPKGGMVELLVKGAKNLTAVKSGGTSDPFVKGYLLPDSNKSTKHKTAVERRTVNPEWNHTFTYCGLQPSDLSNVCLELTVWDKEAMGSNVFLGGVRLGAGTGKSYGSDVTWMDSFGEEQRLWRSMMESPEVPQECTLMLRSSMCSRTNT